MENKFWRSILLIGIAMHFLVAMLMPLGLDTYVHAVYVTDEMDDGEGHLEWGPTRPDSPDSSVPREVPADDKWKAWHIIFEMWFTVFSISASTLHVLGLLGGLGCLSVIYLLTKDLFGDDQALRLTAIASIYHPLVRATGRVYQENVILMLVTISTYCFIRAIRHKSKFNFWFLPPFVCAAIILSFKGMPIWYLPFAGFVLFVSQKIKMNFIQLIIIALIVKMLVLERNGIDLTNPDLIPAILFSFTAYFFFVIGGVLYFTKQDGIGNDESRKISRGSSMVGACLIGWLSALLVTESVSLDRDFIDTYKAFVQTPRYFSLLLVPLWFGRMLRDGTSGISLILNRNLIIFSVAVMLILNSYILATTGPRGTDVVGKHLGEEIEDGEDILFIANSAFSIHRMYSIKFSMDPNSDGDNLGFWRMKDSGWQDELLQCDTLVNVEYIVVFPHIDPIIPDGWVEIEFKDSDLVSDAYHLYEWGEEIERCSQGN